tara:strand:+ start:724 stop:975 length:252 start_codon:yes stop_codon:yes gene_type:complete
LGFFGLAPENKAEIHKQIFQILYYSQGGFTHDDVYCMPTYLRRFYYQELIDTRKKESEEVKKQQRQSKSRTPNIPSINPRFKR